MIHTKTIADGLTVSRALLGFFLIWLGFKGGAAALPVAALILLSAWITDVLDGPLARRDVHRPVTWIGQHNLESDILVATGVWIYLWSAGFITLRLAVGYLLPAAVLLWRTHSVHVGWGVQTVPYGTFIFTSLIRAPAYGTVLIIWIIIVVIVTWPRLLREIVPEFIDGLKNCSRCNHHA